MVIFVANKTGAWRRVIVPAVSPGSRAVGQVQKRVVSSWRLTDGLFTGQTLLMGQPSFSWR